MIWKKGRPWLLHPSVRIGFALVVVVLFAWSYTKPLWVTRFDAPQYPAGLQLEVYLDRVSGDTKEIDLLNQQLGMRPIEKMASFERSIAFGVLALACILAILTASFSKTGVRMLLVLPLILFPLGMLIDIYSWLWYAGHSLDQTSPLSTTVGAFTPVLMGEQQVADFNISSTLGLGTYLQIAGSLLLCGAAAVGWYITTRENLCPAS